MNERLEEEIRGCQMVYRGLFHNRTDHNKLIKELFMRAYNLAMEDVRREVFRELKSLSNATNSFAEGRKTELNIICDTLDNLTK